MAGASDTPHRSAGRTARRERNRREHWTREPRRASWRRDAAFRRRDAAFWRRDAAFWRRDAAFWRGEFADGTPELTARQVQLLARDADRGSLR